VITLDLSVEAGDWDRLGDVEALVQRAADAAIAALREGEGDDLIDGEIAVAVLLTDDAAIREINKEWRAQDKPTNVLSFPAAEQPGMPGPRHIGDLVLAFETTAREAEEEGKTLAAHASHLVVHGVLHCLGYDHETDEDAQEMEAIEVVALRGIGVADPYAETDD
jgi:probable rRNA maturation factor